MTVRGETITGGRELSDMLRTLPVKIEKNIMRSSLRAGASVFLTEVRNNIPLVSGDLRKSARITTRVKKGSLSASVKVGNKKVYYANMVEFGTRPHVISVTDIDRPISKRTKKQVSIRTVNRSLRLGGKLIGPAVKHPGSKPHPYARPAADAAFPAAVKAVTLRIRELLTASGLNRPAPVPSEPAE